MRRLALIAVTLMFFPVCPASAVLLFDDSSQANFLNAPRVAGSGQLTAITVSVPTSINQIGAYVDLNSAGNLKFLIFDLNAPRPATPLFATVPTAFADNGLGFKVSSVFSDFLLSPGTLYGIGGIADVGGIWPFGLARPSDFTQNNITALRNKNGNATTFAAPVILPDSDGVAMGIVQLFGGAQVPEPATLGLLAAGFGLLTAAARRRRGRPS